jgi:hypothetical protein
VLKKSIYLVTEFVEHEVRYRIQLTERHCFTLKKSNRQAGPNRSNKDRSNKDRSNKDLPVQISN